MENQNLYSPENTQIAATPLFPAFPNALAQNQQPWFGAPGNIPGDAPSRFPGGLADGQPGGFPGGQPGGNPGGQPGGQPGGKGPAQTPGQIHLFSGTIRNTRCNRGNRNYFILYNPCKSKTAVFVKEVKVANLSQRAVLVREILCAEPFGDARQSNSVASVDSRDCNYTCPEAQLYSASRLRLENEETSAVYTVCGCDTETQSKDGSLLIAPGDYYILDVCSLHGCSSPDCICTFSWYELSL